MPESFASSEDLGHIALTLRAGGEIWLAAASIYAVEKDPKESFTLVKTMGEPIAVLESPRVIYDTIEAIQRNTETRAKEREATTFADWVQENEIEVYGTPDNPAVLVESDHRMKEIRRRGLAANEKGDPLPSDFVPADDPSEDDEVDYDALSDEEMRQRLREQGIDDHNIESIMEHRSNERFERAAEQEFGEDLGSVMDDMRARDRREEDRG
ncbi:hypothetical protein PBI_DEWDROP_144 [Microbacterium phage Dewdrop]|nr:hypothetical protein PBI_LEAF_144 [Microbacterium phage Leaf]QGZ17512.1 hypothetical protein PBI_DEWDROP_144 [Microbacterium phage Dewdrop]